MSLFLKKSRKSMRNNLYTVLLVSSVPMSLTHRGQFASDARP